MYSFHWIPLKWFWFVLTMFSCRSLICLFLSIQPLWLRPVMVSTKLVLALYSFLFFILFLTWLPVLYVGVWAFSLLCVVTVVYTWFLHFHSSCISLREGSLFPFPLVSALQQTIWLFIRDLFKGICLAIVLGPPIVSAIILIVQVWSPASCHIWFLWYFG